jgi:hypothetical protein
VLRGRLVIFPLLFCLLGTVFATTSAGGTKAGVPTTISFGVTDDAMKYSLDGGAYYFNLMHDLGMTENRVIVFWDENTPAKILEEPFLDRMMPVAAEQGIRIVLAIQPIHALAFATNTTARVAAFADYVRQVALRYPQVHEYVVGNEPNVKRFFQPQHALDGSIVSAGVYEKVLAASYDALKSVDPGITVDGLGLSPQGNDAPAGTGAEGVSPVRFIAALGAAYRASGRTTPIADVVDIHSYAAVNTFPLTQPRKWPQAGPADLDRLKQAWWDAFSGTRQPVFWETDVTYPPNAKFVRFRMDESGTQVGIDPTKVDASLYSGRENVPTVDEATQAKYYADVINLVKCDPTVQTLDLFHLVDEPLLLGFQSGLLRVDNSRRPSYAAVKKAIAAAGTCPALHGWKHTTTVIGATQFFNVRPKPAAQKVFWSQVGTGEEATAEAGIFPAAAPRTIGAVSLREALQTRSGALMELGGLVKANSTRYFKFHGRLTPGRYVFAALLTATMNPARTKLLVSPPFTIR